MKKKQLKRLIKQTIQELKNLIETTSVTFNGNNLTDGEDREICSRVNGPASMTDDECRKIPLTPNLIRKICSITENEPKTLFELAKENTQKMTDGEYREAWLEAYEGAKGKEKAPEVKPMVIPEVTINPRPGKILSKMFPNSMVAKEEVRKPKNNPKTVCKIEQFKPSNKVQIITTISGEDNEQIEDSTQKENPVETSGRGPNKFQEDFNKEIEKGIKPTPRRSARNKTQQVPKAWNPSL